MVLGIPPSPIPAPLPPWARFLLQVLPLIQAGLQEALQYIGPMNDGTAAANSEWRHVQLVAQPVGNQTNSDRAVTTWDIVNITNGAIDNSWTDADYSTVQASLSTLAQLWLPHMGSAYQLVETRYYRRAFNPMTMDKPFQVSGPPERTYPINLPGTSSGSTTVRQVAVTSTDITTYPRHWGRNYWPFPGSLLFTANGFIDTPSVDSWALAVHDSYQALMAAEFFPVVPVTQVAKVPTRGLLGITAIQVDNNPDVMRSRRPKFTTYRKQLPLP